MMTYRDLTPEAARRMGLDEDSFIRELLPPPMPADQALDAMTAAVHAGRPFEAATGSEEEIAERHRRVEQSLRDRYRSAARKGERVDPSSVSRATGYVHK